jgi:hypothetical protein
MGTCFSKRENYSIPEKPSNAIIITHTKFDIPEKLQGYGYSVSEVKNNAEPVLFVNSYSTGII